MSPEGELIPRLSNSVASNSVAYWRAASCALHPASEDFGGRVTVPGGNLRLGPILITYRSLYHSCPHYDQSLHTRHTRTGQPELRSRSELRRDGGVSDVQGEG